jgi:hypothetical protein
MNRDFSAFTLESGLGTDTTATFLQYLNPLKLFLLIFGRDRFHIGILIYLYIQHNLTALLGYGYFSILLKNKDAAVIPALIWAYASYIVLWGQNYSFGTCILMFTLVMYLPFKICYESTGSIIASLIGSFILVLIVGLLLGDEITLIAGILCFGRLTACKAQQHGRCQ